MQVKSLRDYTIKKAIDETSPFTGPKFPSTEGTLGERESPFLKRNVIHLCLFLFYTRDFFLRVRMCCLALPRESHAIFPPFASLLSREGRLKLRANSVFLKLIN